MAMNMNGAWLMFLDNDGKVLASLPWEPFVGFFGVAAARGTAATWVIQYPDGSRSRGVSRVGNIFADEPLRVEYSTVDDWMGELSTAIEPAPMAETNQLQPTVSLTSIPADKTYLRTEVRFSNDVDLSPLANLATAAAWGVSLEKMVTEWRAWHPAARVSWDIDDDGDVWFTFAVEGIGEVLHDAMWLPCDVDELLDEARKEAALAMAPHYVAPAPKPANRDAALRRFADGVTR